MDDTVLPSKLLSRLSSAAETVRRHDFIHVFSHHDADGVSAAGIIASTLTRANKDFRLTLFATMNDDTMAAIKSVNAECILLCDLGASYIKELEALDADVVVLDHHTVYDDSEKIVYANPHLVGIDGMTSGSGATMAFLFAIQMSESNWDLVQIAFAGIAGDRQHINGMLGLNVFLIDGAEKRGLVTRTDGSLIPAGPLVKGLYNSTDPYISGISGNADGVLALINDAGISQNKSYEDLTDEERRKLSSLIAVKLAAQGTVVQTMAEVSRCRYQLRDWGMDAESFANILNACGRTSVGGIGVAACLGDKRSLADAIELNNISKEDVVSGVLRIEKRGLTQMEHIQYFDNSDGGFTGVICGIAMQFIGDPNKPTIGINDSNGKVNVSSRGMWQQLDRGIDLSSAMKRAAESVGGNGGGHRIASGASFGTGKAEEFLRNLDSIVAEQLSSAK